MKLTENEKSKIVKLCIDNPDKSCSIVQTFIDNLQLMPASTYSKLKGKHKNTILYHSEKLTGIKINNQKFLTLNQ